jgi:pimeloyl-ACP methyl ester carboxylesterase
VIERALDLVEGAERFDILGFSVGGWLGQCLAAREARRVRRLVLAHSFTLNAGDAWRFALAARIWPLLPGALFRRAAHERARLALREAMRKDPQLGAQALAGFRAALADPVTLRRLEAQQHLLRDTLRAGDCTASCPILILEGTDDPIVKQPARQRLARRYPGAERLVLDGVGHAAALAVPDAFAAAVDRFLRA